MPNLNWSDSIRQGLYSRLGHEKAVRYNPYALMSLFDMAKASLADRGVSVMGYGNRSQIVNLAFTHSTSDLYSILAGGVEKSVLAGWQDSGALGGGHDFRRHLCGRSNVDIKNILNFFG